MYSVKTSVSVFIPKPGLQTMNLLADSSRLVFAHFFFERPDEHDAHTLDVDHQRIIKLHVSQ